MLTLAHEIEFKSRVNRIGWMLSIMIGVMNVLAIINEMFIGVLWSIGSEKLTVSLGAIVDTVCYLGYFFIPVTLFYVMSRNKPVEPIKFMPKFSKYLPLMILAGIGISFGAGVVNDWFSQAIGYVLPYDDTSRYMNDPEVVALFMTLSLAPAFAEELLFRGVIYTNLRPYGKVFAVLVSSVAFGLMHQNVDQLFYTTVAGICLALIYEATGSIWGSVFMHMFNNLFAVFQTAVMYRYDEASALVILYLSQALVIFLGVVSLIILICVKRKQENDREKDVAVPPQGTFGDHRAAEPEPYDLPMPMRRAVKLSLKAPGVICFLVLAIGSALMLVVMYSGGGGMPV